MKHASLASRAFILGVVLIAFAFWHQRPGTQATKPAAVATPKMPPAPPLQVNALAGVDVRKLAPRVPVPRQNQPAELARLRKQIPGVEVTFDELTGTPSLVQATGSFLTPAAVRDMPAREIVASFVAQYPGIFGVGANTVLKAPVAREDKTAATGLQTLVLEQEVDGIRLYRTTLKANLGRQGELVSLSSGFLDSPVPNAGVPAITPNEAVSRAAASLETIVPASKVSAQDQAVGAERQQKFQAPGLSDTTAHLTYLPMNDRDVRLGWDVTLVSLARQEMHRVVVDAQDGSVLVRMSLTNSLQDATYNVYAKGTGLTPLKSPAPMTPTLQTPATTQAPEVPRVSITTQGLDATASPNGWVADGANPETVGNNVDAHTDINHDNVADLPRPNGGTTRTFDFPLDLTQSPSTYRSAAVTQLFFVNNWMHDRLYQLGFTETAGNFQTDNFSRGGHGNDAVQADCQDGGGTSNANFSTPSDGSPGRMQMYVFTDATPARDGSLDSEIMIHEYCHGLSNRLVGGGVGIDGLQPEGMGEGWSDFYSIALLTEPTENLADAVAAAGYSTYQLNGVESNYYSGIRRYPYSVDKQKNPLTLQDINHSSSGGARVHDGIPLNKMFWKLSNDSSDEVHDMGEVWCNTLLEMRRLLVTKLGFEAGTALTLQLVTDAMKLCPQDPTFLQSRDAIIQADLVSTSGANAQEIWTAFAKRGMGKSAVTPANYTTFNVVEAYDSPGTMALTPVTAFSPLAKVGTSAVTSEVYTLKNTGATPLHWAAAKTQAWTTVTPVSGTLAAGASVKITWKLNAATKSLAAGETFDTLTLTDTTTGATQMRPLIFNVNALPSFTAQPQSHLYAVGSSPNPTFSVSYAGTEKMLFTWLKNAIGNYGSSKSLNLGYLALTSAGSYSVKLTNPAGTLTSAKAQLAILDVSSQIVPFNDGTTLSIPLSYKGTGLTFLWMRNGTVIKNGDLGGRVSGATTGILSIARFTAADVAAGNNFTCKVSLGADQLVTGNHQALVRNAPVIAANPSPPTMMTSAYVSWSIGSLVIQSNNQPENKATSYVITGLPAGLTYNAATGQITGYPKVTGLTSVKLTIKAINGKGSGTATVTVPFRSLPALAYGEFRGLIGISSAGNKGLGAYLQLSISSIGTLTGQIHTGTAVLPLIYKSYDAQLNGSTFTVYAQAPSGTHYPLYLTFYIDITTGNISGNINGSVPTGSYYTSLTARRIPWTSKAPAVLANAFAGAYSAVLQPTVIYEPTYPSGYAYLTSSVSTLGAMTGAARFADGVSATFSSSVSAAGDVPLYATAYANTGSLTGWSTLNATTRYFDGSPTFGKAAQAASSTTRSYKSGIYLTNLTLVGGPWVKPVSPTLPLGVTDGGMNNVKLEFTQASITTSNLAVGGTYTAPFRIKSLPFAGIALPSPNPGAISIALNVTTGVFNGSFTTKDDNPFVTGTQLVTRTAPYFGVIVQRLGHGYGHFNLPLLPSMAQPVATKTDILSGKVTLSPLQ